MSNLLDRLDEIKEMAKDYLDGMSSKDKVTAGGILAISLITIANIIWGGGDDSSSSLPDVGDADDDDAEQ